MCRRRFQNGSVGILWIAPLSGGMWRKTPRRELNPHLVPFYDALRVRTLQASQAPAVRGGSLRHALDPL